MIWIVASKFVIPLFLPSPKSVILSFKELLLSGTLTDAIAASFFRIVVATLISVLISIPLGLIAVNYEIIYDLITPVTSLIRFIPVTAFYPLLIMWVGIGELMKILFLFIATFFYFFPTVMLALKETNQDLLDTAYTMGMSKIKVMFQVMLPYSIPSICQSFLMMYGIGWTYVVIAEIINAKKGLGFIMNLGSIRGRTDLVFVSIITILFINVIIDYLGNYMIKRAFKWKFAKEIDD
jgi:NitT/TauT family transport system permease protein